MRVVEGPLGDAHVGRGAGRRLQAPFGIRHQQGGAGAEGAADGGARGVYDLLGLERAGQLAREFVQRARTLLAVRRHARLETQAGCQVAGDQADRQHDAEGYQVLQIGDGKVEARRDEEKVEARHRKAGAQHRWPASEAHRHQHHHQQEQHDDVGQVDVADQRREQQRGSQAGRARPGIGRGAPFAAVERQGDGVRFRHRLGLTRLAAAGFDQVDIGRDAGNALAVRAPPGPGWVRARKHQFRHVVLARVADDGVGDVAPRQHRRGRAQFLRQAQGLEGQFAPGRRIALQGRRFHVHGMPVGAELAGQARGAAHHMLGIGARAHASEQRTAGLPHRADRFFDAVGAHVIFDPVGGTAQGQLAQGDQVPFAEKIFRGAFGLFRLIHLAAVQARQQFVGRQVDQHHFVGAVEHGIGHGFGHAHAGNAPDHVVQAVQVLDVDGGEHVDAGRQQLFHILPALGMARAGRVGVGQLVDQDQGRRGGQGGIEVELAQRLAAVGEHGRGEQVQAIEQGGGVGAAVGFEHADQHRHAVVPQLAGGDQHGASLADAGRGAEIDAQLAARSITFVGLDLGQQGVGVGALGFSWGHGRLFSRIRLSIRPVRRAIEHQLIHARCPGQHLDPLARQRACARHPARLVARRQADVRIESAGRCGDQIRYISKELGRCRKGHVKMHASRKPRSSGGKA